MESRDYYALTAADYVARTGNCFESWWQPQAAYGDSRHQGDGDSVSPVNLCVLTASTDDKGQVTREEMTRHDYVVTLHAINIT
ncbi:hypothetical protein VRRI112168_08215 [Vreelandella rituensis]